MNHIRRHAKWAAVMAAFFLPGASLAQPLCGERQKLLDALAKDHDEAPTALGLAATGQIVEVLTAPSGSWSIIVSQPNGRACLMGAGQGWQELPREPKKEERPS